MVEEPDMTDDWMNPSRSTSYTHREPQFGDPTEYLIEREKRRITFGSPGSITNWEYWDKFDTAESRDAALARLVERHPMWHLRARDRNPWMEKVRSRF
jgi:hypothetical protein